MYVLKYILKCNKLNVSIFRKRRALVVSLKCLNTKFKAFEINICSSVFNFI